MIDRVKRDQALQFKKSAMQMMGLNHNLLYDIKHVNSGLFTPMLDYLIPILYFSLGLIGRMITEEDSNNYGIAANKPFWLPTRENSWFAPMLQELKLKL